MNGDPPPAELLVRVRPRAGRDELAGEHDGRLIVRVSAPPAGGRANEAVRKLLASRLRVAPSRVRIAGGHATRDKRVLVDGVTTAEALARLGPVP